MSDHVDERLARLRAGTEGLAPPLGLVDRINARVASRPRGIAAVVLPFGRPALVVSALAAAAAVVLAFQGGLSIDGGASEDAAADVMWWEP